MRNTITLWWARLFVVGTVLCIGFLDIGGVIGYAEAKAKDTLVVGITELPPTIDAERATHPMAWYFFQNLSDQLLTYKRVPSPVAKDVSVLDYDHFEFWLAESFDITDDHKTVTFHLRKGVKSSFGNELTSRDLYWKYERGLALHGLSEYFFGTMDMPRGLEHVKVIDDYTISLTAQRPNFLLTHIQSMNCGGILDSTEAKKHATADDPWATDYLARNVPSYGPYYVTNWSPGNMAVFEANPNYWKGPPAFKRVIMKVVPESSSRVAMIRDGTLDVAHELSPREIASLRDTPNVRTIEDRGFWLAHLVMNDLVVKPFGNKSVRQAINYAIDRGKIIDMAYFGMAEPMKVVFAAQRPGALNPKEFPYEQNLTKANELMAEAGYSDGFEVELYYQAGLTAHETACVLIKEDLAKIGIDVTLRRTPIGALETVVRSAKVPFAYWRETPFAPDPNYAVTLMYLNGPATGGTGYCNYSGFNHATINKMIMDGKPIVDKKKRWNHHYELQRLILQEAPIGFVVQEGYMQAIRDNLRGWSIDIGEAPRYAELYIE
jgi:peptide/nickel transport system substrate-binding protein